MRTLAYAGGGIITVLVLALLGWYLFLRAQSDDLAQLGAGRGLGVGTPTFMNPSGSTYANFAERTGAGVSATSTDPAVRQTPRLWRVSVTPAAGVRMTTADVPSPDTQATSSAQTPTVRTHIHFIDRATGQLFAADAFTGTIERITNTLIPNVHSAQWAGERIILRYENENGQIETFSGEITSATTTNETGEIIEQRSLEGVYLDTDIVALAVHPRAEDEIFYLHQRGDGIAGIRADADGGGAESIWSFPIRGWALNWHTPSTAALVQHPTAHSTNSAYALSLSNGALTPLVLNQRGMEILPHIDGDRVLYNTLVQGRPALFIQDGSGTRPISVQTFAEKCVWDPTQDAIVYCAVPQILPQALYPESWYRGEVHFADAWWKINTEEGTVEQLIAPDSEYGVALDVIAPIMNEQGTHIAFLDATTRTPWVLRIEP